MYTGDIVHCCVLVDVLTRCLGLSIGGGGSPEAPPSGSTVTSDYSNHYTT